MTISGVSESFKSMNRPGPTWPDLFDGYFMESIKDKDVIFLHNLHWSLQFVLSKFVTDTSDSLEAMRFLAT